MNDTDDWSRRKLLQAVAAGAGSAAVLSSLGTASAAQEDIGTWPEFGYDAGNTSYAPTESAPLGDVTPDWELQGPDGRGISPAVVDGTVYVPIEDTVIAVDAATGDRKWTSRVGGPMRSAAAVANGDVFLGCDDEYIYALDAGTGDRNWRVQTGGEVYTAPTVVDGTLYQGSQNDFYVIDTATGEIVWDRRNPEGIANDLAAFDDGTIFQGTQSLNALDDILKRALARERTDRYESVLYLRDDLREVVADVHESWLVRTRFCRSECFYYHDTSRTKRIVREGDGG